MIPEAAVEAAARTMTGVGEGVWNRLHPLSRATALTKARTALEAAAPYIQAEAWEEGMEAMYDSTSHEWPPIPEQNPYRSPRA